MSAVLVGARTCLAAASNDAATNTNARTVRVTLARKNAVVSAEAIREGKSDAGPRRRGKWGDWANPGSRTLERAGADVELAVYENVKFSRVATFHER